MRGIAVENLRISFGGDLFMDNLSFGVPDGEVGVLLGLSGSGKSTILKTILGVQKPDQGRVLLNEMDVTNQEIRKRNIGYVPQNQLLFPNMSVTDNIAYGLKMRKIPREKQRSRVKEVADMVGIDFLERDPKSLSGGERQRVALARAIAPQPKTLLMDEPLSSLDTAERLAMSLMLKKVLDGLDVTTLYVTHSPQEAEILADRVMMLESGRIVQQGTFKEIQTSPSSLSIAGILGIRNVFSVDQFSSLDLSPFKRGDLYIIPPKSIIVDENGVEARIIAHSGDMTFISVEGQILSMSRVAREGVLHISLDI